MEPRRIRCVLSVPEGPSRRVGPSGLLIGRKPDCDLVTAEPSASRRHAFVRLTPDGAELVPLGRGGVFLNGTAIDQPSALADGDRLGLPGLDLTVALSVARPERAGPSGWSLERVGGGVFGLAHTPFVIGGADSADLIVRRWPEHTVRLHLASGELFVEAVVAKVSRNGVALEVGATEPLAAGDQLAFRKEGFVVRQAAHDATTAVAVLGDLPQRVHIEILPRGGRLVIGMAAGDRAVVLADKRLELLVALLRPPTGYRAGDFIPDDVVAAVVWPRAAGATRLEINVLIGRCRRDLVEAGLPGPRLIERAPAGGATRFVLAAGATVTLES